MSASIRVLLSFSRRPLFRFISPGIIDMGSGASNQHQSINHAQVIATPSHPVPSMYMNNAQQQMQPHVQSEINQDKDTKDERITEPQTSIEWQVLHNATLRTYKLNYPELSDILQEMFDHMQALINFVDSSSSGRKDYSSLGVTLESLFPLATEKIRSFLGTPDADSLLNFTVDIEGAEVLQRLASHSFEDYYDFLDQHDEDDSDNETLHLAYFGFLVIALGIIQNFADIHDGFCSACAKAGVISMCLENIQRVDAEVPEWDNRPDNQDEESKELHIINFCVGILNNISRRLRDPELFANSEGILLRFAKVKKRSVASASLLCLAYLVNEDTNHLILADENLLCFIITMLNEAWQSEDRRSNGYSAKELAEGLSHLAINDTNKKVLGNKGAIHVLMSVLRNSKEEEEKASAARALWMLAFDENNKDAIRQQAGGLEMLRELQHSKDLEVQRAAAGALWELEGKTSRIPVKKEITGNHVMISYQWDNQDVLIEVKNRLQASGYRVWMDLEQMGGSTLEAMAKAVESSSVVLVCVSQKYKESPNCRSEAEYAYQLRKDIIPLMMQRKYKADGWLGMLVGTKLWIDFQSKHVTDAGVGKLIKELGGRGKDVDVTDGPTEPVVRRVEADVIDSQPSAPAVSGWTNQEVKQWLKEIGLEKVCKEDISEVNGETLIDLQQLREECPEYFYRCLEQNLNLRNMVDVFKFRKELKKLQGY